MQLQTLFGPERNEIWTSGRKKDNINLKYKFNGLVRKFNLEVFQDKNGLWTACDDSGWIFYKKVLDYEWFQWKPDDFKRVAEDIYNMTGGYLLAS